MTEFLHKSQATLQALGRYGLDFFNGLGRAHIFIAYVLLGMHQVLARWQLIVVQIYAVGALSFVIIVVSGVFVGIDRKSTRLNSSHMSESRMPSSA